MASLELNIKQVNSDFQGIKAAITAKGVEVANGTATSEYADKVNEVYEKGKQDEWNMFWDTFQNKGSRTSYFYAFAYGNFNSNTFKPKYDIVPTNANQMFKGATGLKMNLTKERIGVNVDFSKATNANETFNGTWIPVVDVVDLSSITGKNAHGMFGYNYYTHTINKLIVHENMSLENFFVQSNNFQHITIEGTIADSVSIHASKKLTKASILSFFNALSDTTSGLTFTVNQTAVNNAFETASGMADGSTSEEWLNLIATKPNWTISLS